MKQKMFLLLLFIVLTSFFSFGQEKEIDLNDELAFVFINFWEIDSACHFVLSDVYFESNEHAILFLKDGISSWSDQEYLMNKNFVTIRDKELRGVKYLDEFIFDIVFPNTFFIVVESCGQVIGSKIIISVFVSLPENFDNNGKPIDYKQSHLLDIPGVIEEDSSGFLWFKPVGSKKTQGS
jgi:hypothetical protein